jgi:hypothetical protein
MAPASGNDGDFVVSKHARKPLPFAKSDVQMGWGCPAMPRKPKRCPEMEDRGKVCCHCIEHGNISFQGLVSPEVWKSS